MQLPNFSDQPLGDAAEPFRPSPGGTDALGGELSPWIAVSNQDGQQQVALWQVRDSDQQAIALFSTEDKAKQYAQSVQLATHQIVQLDQIAVVRLLVDAHHSGHKFAALDPTEESVRSLFNIADVLRSARDTLKSN
ncbi:MAG: hypothetical protein Aurels2KO_46970 [Aureliella sp.]